MEPIIEKIPHDPINSFVIAGIPYGPTEPFWHLHPEYEIVYIKNGSEKQRVGSHFSNYKNGTLLMIGPNIPHSVIGNYKHSDNYAVVIQMSRTFLEKKLTAFNEMLFVSDLLERSKQGILFGDKFKAQISIEIEKLPGSNRYNRLINLFNIIGKMAASKDYTLLNSNVIHANEHSNSYYRIGLINKFVAENYHRNIHLSEIAGIAGLTESSFSRFFKKVTGKTFINFLNEYRVHKSCALLSNKNYNIADVMYKTGFSEASHFTRVFKKHAHETPRSYRNKIFEVKEFK
jgi:AraC-like DNA-binding protein